MKVISLVPSWTETLLAAGVQVVGRTRFCVHPASLVEKIAVVGGTKDLDLARLEGLKPDLVIVDKEENLPWMAESQGWKVHCTHIERTDDLPDELDTLSEICANRNLKELANEWRSVLEQPAYPKDRVSEFPGLMRWIRSPQIEPEQILYLIWRGPWMAVSRNTFIGSMISHLGFGGRLPHFEEKYPKIDLSNFDPAKTLLLFSSEPYPFGKKVQELQGLDFASALVDGEAYSWFGVRSLRFLQEQKK